MNMMVVKQFEFAAGHFLPGYPGKCANPHGHNFVLEIGVEGFVNSETGMVMDFSKLKKIVSQEIVDILDHSFLNDLKRDKFPWQMPTAENIVDWVLWKLLHLWEDSEWEDGEIALVRLWETSTSYAEWRKK